MYSIVASALLTGGMVDVLHEDKTLMPPGPRRVKGQRFYAWLVEGDPAMAGRLKRETRESGSFSIVTIGSGIPNERVTLDQIRAQGGMVLEQEEANRLRRFVAVFARDRLLPYFRKTRADFLRVAALAESSRYAAFGEFFAWYYNQMVNAVAEEFVAARLITPPDLYYSYALRLPLQ
jgi:hypothetical protein